MKHSLRWLKLSVVASFAFLVPTAASGQVTFQNPPTGHNLVLKSALGGNFCLDETQEAGRVNRVVYVFSCHGRASQRWAITENEEVIYGAHTFSLVAADGKCLDVFGAKVGDHTPLQAYPCHLRPNQRFLLAPSGTLIERQSGKCLTVAGPAERAPVFIDECVWGNVAQKWSIQPNP